MSKTKADDFLENMKLHEAEPAKPAAAPKPPREPKPKKEPSPVRQGLKHIGGYLDLDTVEKVAVLRARLRLDNSELIKLAIEDLHRKHMAKRAFGDA